MPVILSADGGGIPPATVPPGAVLPFAGSNSPYGYLLCDGSSVLRLDYPALFTTIGTTYGSVDGTHFTLPDMRSNVPIGKSATYALGATGGEATHLLTAAESGVPSHTHNYHSDSGAGTSSYSATPPTNNVRVGDTAGLGNPNANAANAHNNLQPYLAMNYIIKT